MPDLPSTLEAVAAGKREVALICANALVSKAGLSRNEVVSASEASALKRPDIEASRLRDFAVQLSRSG